MNVPLTPLRFIRYAAEQFPHKVGVVCDSKRFTYAEFAERAGKLGSALVAEGAKPDDRIAFLSTNCHRLLEAYYGVLEAGCVLLPLNVRLAPTELAYVINDSGSRILFFESRFLQLVEAIRPHLQTIEKYILLDGAPSTAWMAPKHHDDLIAAHQPLRRDIMTVDENSLAELFYTSGTSDNPKGVMLTHRNIYLHALAAIISVETSPATVGHASCDSVVLHTIPLFHANGWGAAHTVTQLGGRHVMIHTFSTTEIFRLVQEERVTSFGIVPTMGIALVNCPERPKYDLSSLKHIGIGGSASSPTLVKQIEEKLGCYSFSGYGLTETSPILAQSFIKPGFDWPEAERHASQARTGFAIPGVEVRVVDAKGGDVPHDGQAIGEIVARGDVVMAGYWRQPEATATAMRDGWFHTGDMATIDEHGYVLIVDRKKDIIVSGGENISSLEVEKALSAHPAVYEVVVIPADDPVWGEVPKALVVLKPDAKATETELIEFSRARLSHYKCPRSVEFLASLPKTGTGKLLKRELRERYRTSKSVAHNP